MTADQQVIQATRAAFEDLLDESPLAPDWERVTGQIVPLRPNKRRYRRAYLLAAAVAAAVFVIAGAVLFSGGPWRVVNDGDMIAPGAQTSVCSLFTEEEVTAIALDAYAAVGLPAPDWPTLLVENFAGRVHADACDWNALGNPLIILERIQDDQSKPHWDTGDYYTAIPPERTWAPNELLPPGVEVDYARVGPGWAPEGQEGTTVRIDIRVVGDAPQWWRFSMWTTSGEPGHRPVAEDLAMNVAGQMFETIIRDS